VTQWNRAPLMEVLLKSSNKKIKTGAHLFIQLSGYKRCLAKTSFHTLFLLLIETWLGKCIIYFIGAEIRKLKH